MVAHYEMMTLKVSDLDRVRDSYISERFCLDGKEEKTSLLKRCMKGFLLELYWFIQKVKIQSRS